MEAASRVPWCALLIAILAGCYGEASLDLGSHGDKPPAEVPDPPLPPTEPDGSLTCELDLVPPTVTLAGIAADFAREVQPVLLRQESGCISCHATTSGRQFKVSQDGQETFYAARAAGLLRPTPGSLLSRLVATDESARMPRGQPSWSAAEIARVASLTCQLAAVEARHPQTPPDEEFPPRCSSRTPGRRWPATTTRSSTSCSSRAR